MKKFIKNILLPTFIGVMTVIGMATTCWFISLACYGQNHSTSMSVMDMTQDDIDTLINDNENLNTRLNDCIRTIDAYRTYHDRVEQLLDKVGIDVDSPLLETDEGAEYLDKKWIIDSLENENLGTPSANK